MLNRVSSHIMRLAHNMSPLGARPGHGKTRLSPELTVEAMTSGYRGIFFTLEYNETNILNLFNPSATWLGMSQFGYCRLPARAEDRSTCI